MHLRAGDVRVAISIRERRHPLGMLTLDCVDAGSRQRPRAAGWGEALRQLEVDHGRARERTEVAGDCKGAVAIVNQCRSALKLRCLLWV